MPDANGNIKGTGWTRRRAEGWERVFGTYTEPEPPSRGTLKHPDFTWWEDEIADRTRRRRLLDSAQSARERANLDSPASKENPNP